MELAELCGIVDALSRDERRRALCGDPEQKNWRNTAEFGCVVAIFFAGLRNGGGTTDWSSGAEQKRPRRETDKLPAVEFYRKYESKTEDLYLNVKVLMERFDVNFLRKT